MLRALVIVTLVAALLPTADAQALCGDANRDGSVSILDALAVAQHAVGVALLPAEAIPLADVDLSGAIDVLDALRIAQSAAGLMVTLTCGEVWVELFPAASPPGRESGGLAYDSVRGEVVIFGGVDNTPPALYGDTWVWDGVTWTQRFPATSPSARRDCAMAFDASLGVTLLFGGVDSVPRDDTWAWDGTNWTEVMPMTRPATRQGATLVYDPMRMETVLFGGFNGFTPAYLNDTWTWDGVDWTQESPPTSPSPRQQAISTWDPNRNAVVLFGGDPTVGSYIDETWEWNGATWTQLSPATCPSRRRNAAFTYDPNRNVCVLFGGIGDAITLGETWHWTGTDWEQPLVAVAPIERHGCRAVYDPNVGAVLLFGGRDPFVRFPDDTWTY